MEGKSLRIIYARELASRHLGQEASLAIRGAVRERGVGAE